MSAPAIGRAPIRAEGHNSRAPMYRWDGNPPRNPRKGEFYISGAIPTAYKAHRDIESPFFIAVPVKDDPFTPEELATVLAALRYWQRHRPSNPELHAIATDDGTLTPLDSEEIDALCERLNA